MTNAGRLADRLRECGFEVRPWKDQRIYLEGYGRLVQAYIEPAPGDSMTAEGGRIVVESRWRSGNAGLHAKGVKHAILSDLYAAGLLAERPVADWRQVKLDDRRAKREITRAERPSPQEGSAARTGTARHADRPLPSLPVQTVCAQPGVAPHSPRGSGGHAATGSGHSSTARVSDRRARMSVVLEASTMSPQSTI